MKTPHFWKADQNPHEQVFSRFRSLSKAIQARNLRWQRWMKQYLGRAVTTGFTPGEISVEEAFKRVRGEEKELKLNPSENCLSALSARIASQRPRASFLVSSKGPDAWTLKRDALNMEKFVAGEWRRGRFHQKTVKVFLHSGILGLGAMHIYPGEDRVIFDVAAPWELIVDEQAAADGETRELLRIKYVPAEVLIARFAGSQYGSKFAKANQAAIEKASKNAGATMAGSGYPVTADLVPTIEAWHLDSGWGAEDGCHVICIDGRTLTPKEEWAWDRPRFPFAFFPWSEPVIGWYPQGLVEKEEPVQGQMNKMFGRLQEILHLYGVMNTFYEEGAIKKEHMKNTSGNLIPVKPGSQMPVPHMPATVPSDFIRFVGDLRGWVFEETGVSQLSAASVKPAGIDSGRGLMVLKDSEGGRHATTNNAWDDFHNDSAELTVDAGRDVAKRNPNYTVNNVDQGVIEPLKWKDLDRHCYEIAIFPSSQLPHEPGGRAERVEQLMNAGFIDKRQAMVLMRMPDLEQFESLEVAAYEDIQMQIEQMLVDGEEAEPQKYQDLALGLALMTSALLRAGQQGAPKERIDLLIRWIEKADQMLEEQKAEELAAQAAAQPTQPQPPMPPVEQPAGPM